MVIPASGMSWDREGLDEYLPRPRDDPAPLEGREAEHKGCDMSGP